MNYSANQHLRILTLWQPWASLVAWGEKECETRPGRFPKYTGWVAIHAAAGKQDYAPIKNTYLGRALERNGWPLKALPRGKILCVVWFDEAQVASEWKRRLENLGRHAEIEFGNYGLNRRAIPLYHRKVLAEPIEWRGGQGLRSAPLDLREKIAHQLAA